MRDRGSKPTTYLAMLLGAGVLAAAVQWVPTTWPPVVRFLLTVLGAVAGGAAGSYVSEWINARRAIRAERDAAPAATVARRAALIATRELAPDSGSVAALLRPERGVVGFIGRERELEMLRAWCLDEVACPLRLLTGRGGVGKTRLALRLMELLPVEQWSCQTVRPGGEVAAVQAASGLDKRVLLLVDYAETRSALPDMLAEIASLERTGHTAWIRVLLLARRAGEWWSALQAEPYLLRDLVARVPRMELAATVDEEYDNRRILSQSLPFFSAARGRRAPQIDSEVDINSQLPILVLHAAALVAVLDDEQGAPGGWVSVDRGILDKLLGHERRLWYSSAERAGLTMALAVLEQAVAVVAVLGADSESRARQVLERIPDLADVDSERIGDVVRWLKELYPGDENSWLDPLRPDLLIERHVSEQLAKSEELTKSVFADLEVEDAVQVLTILNRASVHHEKAPEIIRQALHCDLMKLAHPCIKVSVQSGGALPRIFSEALQEESVPLSVLIYVYREIPEKTYVLAAAQSISTGRVIRELPPTVDERVRATWLSAHSWALSQEGRYEEALPYSRAVVEVWERESERDPDRYEPILASSLNRLAINLWRCGLSEEALPPALEGAGIYQRLAADTPKTFMREVASALANTAIWLSDLDNDDDALPVARKAIVIRRRLGDAPDNQASLAAILNTLGVIYARSGSYESALRVGHESVLIRRRLAQRWPDAFQGDLARSLSNVGRWLVDSGEPAEAPALLAEAIEIQQRVVDIGIKNADEVLNDYLYNYTYALLGAGQINKGCSVVEVLLEKIKKSERAYPGRQQFRLIDALFIRAALVVRLRRFEESLSLIYEVIDLYERMRSADSSPPIPIDQQLYNRSTLLEVVIELLKEDMREEAVSLHERMSSLCNDQPIFLSNWAFCASVDDPLGALRVLDRIPHEYVKRSPIVIANTLYCLFRSQNYGEILARTASIVEEEILLEKVGAYMWSFDPQPRLMWKEDVCAHIVDLLEKVRRQDNDVDFQSELELRIAVLRNALQ